jgi:hypothetical protein
LIFLLDAFSSREPVPTPHQVPSSAGQASLENPSRRGRMTIAPAGLRLSVEPFLGRLCDRLRALAACSASNRLRAEYEAIKQQRAPPLWAAGRSGDTPILDTVPYCQVADALIR